jgi:hypothetical protein
MVFDITISYQPGRSFGGCRHGAIRPLTNPLLCPCRQSREEFQNIVDVLLYRNMYIVLYKSSTVESSLTCARPPVFVGSVQLSYIAIVQYKYSSARDARFLGVIQYM